MRSYDPKHASPMISTHSDQIRALNAPFFCYHKFHIFTINHFVSKISQIFYFQNLKLARLKLVHKNIALTCKMRSYDPKKVPPMISIHSDCFRSLNAPFVFLLARLKAQNYHFFSKSSGFLLFELLRLAHFGAFRALN